MSRYTTFADTHATLAIDDLPGKRCDYALVLIRGMNEMGGSLTYRGHDREIIVGIFDLVHCGHAVACLDNETGNYTVARCIRGGTKRKS